MAENNIGSQTTEFIDFTVMNIYYSNDLELCKVWKLYWQMVLIIIFCYLHTEICWYFNYDFKNYKNKHTPFSKIPQNSSPVLNLFAHSYLNNNHINNKS